MLSLISGSLYSRLVRCIINPLKLWEVGVNMVCYQTCLKVICVFYLNLLLDLTLVVHVNMWLVVLSEASLMCLVIVRA